LPVCSSCQRTGDADTFARLPQLKAPTLVLGGHYDGSCPPDITRALAGQIPGARYELMESGHGDWYFDPAVWDMIIGFLLKSD